MSAVNPQAPLVTDRSTQVIRQQRRTVPVAQVDPLGQGLGTAVVHALYDTRCRPTPVTGWHQLVSPARRQRGLRAFPLSL